MSTNMTTLTRFWIVFFFCFAQSHRVFAVAERNVGNRLKRDIEKSGFKNSEIGIWVGTAIEKSEQPATVFALNADRGMIPASTSKLVTLGAVLHELHPGYRFKTSLMADAKIVNEVLSGSLYLKGGGDPSFVSENMWFLVNELTRTGITRIDGDVIVDDGLFDQIRWDEDRQEERVDRAYDAPVGAMSMNWNSVNVYFRPGDAVGDKLRVVADVMTPYLKLRNETKTVAAGRGKTVSVERVSEKGFDGDVIVVSGSMALGLSEQVVYKNITRPDLWSGFNLVEFLKQRGITVGGKVRAGPVSKGAIQLAFVESKPLSMIVADMAKWSNNYVAEMLVKNLATTPSDSSTAKPNAPGTMAAGMVKLSRFLESSGVKKGEYEFVNAAGFTRKNRLTPAQLGHVLERVHADFTLFPEFLAALPIAGVDGTLRNRMKNQPAERWVRAKTGLLNGVVGLAGFAGRPNGQIMSFVFLYNGSGREDKARATFDQMAARLVED